MATVCSCPGCGRISDGRESRYGEIKCPECGKEYWIPQEVFDSAPYARMSCVGLPIIEVYFSPFDGYRVKSRNMVRQYILGWRYDPFTGLWSGGDYFRTEQEFEKANSGYFSTGRP